MAGSLPAKNTEPSQTAKQGPGTLPLRADSNINSSGIGNASLTTAASSKGQQTDTGSQQLTDAVSNPAVAVIAVLLFSLVASDVAGSSQFLPHHLDQPVHRWVSSSLPVGVRDLVGEKLVRLVATVNIMHSTCASCPTDTNSGSIFDEHAWT